MSGDYPQTFPAVLVARKDVVHRVAVEHEPYTIHRPGVTTCAIVTTACKRAFQGVPVTDLLATDRMCSQCEQAAEEER